MLEIKPQNVLLAQEATCPRCGNIHASRQIREDYCPQVEAVFCNRCGNVSVHELLGAEPR